MINNAVFLCISGLIVLNAVPIHWFPISWPKNLPSPVVTKIAINVILWFLKKAKLNRRFLHLIRKLALKFSKKSGIRKTRLQSNDVEICFLNWRSTVTFAWTKLLYRTWSYWFIIRLFGWFSDENPPCHSSISTFQWDSTDQPIINMNIPFSNAGRLKFY